MMGFMYGENPNLDGLRGNESNPYNPLDPQSPVIVVSDEAEFVDPDPGHSLNAATQQVFGYPTNCAAAACPSPAPMNGFVANAEAVRSGMGVNVMRGFKPSNVPVMAELSRQFATFDRWYSSVPGPTQPNRLYLHSGSSHGMAFNDEVQLARGFSQKSIYELLSENDVTWKSYFQLVPATVFFKWMRRPENWGNFHHFSVFREHAAAGTLPSFSFIDPMYFDVPSKAQNDGNHRAHPSARPRFILTAAAVRVGLWGVGQTTRRRTWPRASACSRSCTRSCAPRPRGRTLSSSSPTTVRTYMKRVGWGMCVCIDARVLCHTVAASALVWRVRLTLYVCVCAWWWWCACMCVSGADRTRRLL
jgi:hypothetical protein